MRRRINQVGVGTILSAVLVGVLVGSTTGWLFPSLLGGTTEARLCPNWMTAAAASMGFIATFVFPAFLVALIPAGILEWVVRSNTVYAITDRRVVSLVTWPWRKVKATDIDKVPAQFSLASHDVKSVSFGDYANGSLFRIFGPEIFFGHTEHPVFHDVKDGDGAIASLGQLTRDPLSQLVPAKRHSSRFFIAVLSIIFSSWMLMSLCISFLIANLSRIGCLGPL